MFAKVENEASYLKRDNYSAWLVRETDYKGIPDLLKWAVLAPSSHNTQPWQFSVDGNSIVVSPDLKRRLEVSDSANRQLYISLGAAVANLKVAAHYFGWEIAEVIEEHDGVVTKKIGLQPDYKRTPEDETLFKAITERVSNRRSHQSRAIPQEMHEAVNRFTDDLNLQVEIVEDKERLAKVGELTGEGEQESFSDINFRAELEKWVRPSTTENYDGMPISSLVSPSGIMPNFFIEKGFWAVVKSGIGSGEAARITKKLISQQTAAVGMISASDNPESWMKAGELFEKIALKATSLGLSISVLAVLIETGEFHKDLQEVVGLKERPQMMFRLGYPSAEAPLSPRWRAEKLTERDSLVGDVEVADDVQKPRIFALQKGVYQLEDLVKELEQEELKRRFSPRVARAIWEIFHRIPGLRNKVPIISVTDDYTRVWTSELFMNRNPQIDFRTEEGQQALEENCKSRDNNYEGVWAYYPWKNSLIHIPEEDEFYELMYSRNFPTIEKEVQENLRNLKVGICGMSVGRDIAFALMMLGITKLSVADFDPIAPSNLNRMGAVSIFEVGENKTKSFTRSAYEFNPFTQLKLYPQGLNSGNLREFVTNVDLVIDEMDAFPFKNLIRDITKEQGKYALMATDYAFTPVIDVEGPNDPKFGGRASESIIAGLMKGPRDKFEATRMVVEVVGSENTPTQVLRNFNNVAEKKQNYWSQTGPTCYVAAGQLAYYVYEIARGNADKLEKSKRLHLEQPDLFDPRDEQRVREEFIKLFNYPV